MISKNRIKRRRRRRSTASARHTSSPPILIGGVLLLALLFIAAAANDFDPYVDNGGVVAAIAGKDFGIIACDTRMKGPGGYLLQSRARFDDRLWSLGDAADELEEASPRRSAILKRALEHLPSPLEPLIVHEEIYQDGNLPPAFCASAGCAADARQLRDSMRQELRAVSSDISGGVLLSTTSSRSIATLLSQTLYTRRGFPYGVHCVLLSWDTTKHRPNAFVYDAIGSFENLAVVANGEGKALLQPILDRSFHASKNHVNVVEETKVQAIAALVKAYQAVSERDIAVGDRLLLCVTSREEMEESSQGDYSTNHKYKCQWMIVPLKEH